VGGIPTLTCLLAQSSEGGERGDGESRKERGTERTWERGKAVEDHPFPCCEKLSGAVLLS
jgi:hypothetical protein